MTLDETSNVMTALAGMYPGTKIDKNTITGYSLLLADIDYATLVANLPTILDNYPTFMPTAVQLRQAIVGTPADQAGIATGAEAWEEVQREVRSKGFMRGGRFEDELLQRAVNAVGWEAICMCEFKDMGTLRAQFRDIYESFRGTAIKEIAAMAIESGAKDRKALKG